MVKLKEIAQYYQLELHLAERYGKCFKLYTNKGNYALKELPAERGVDFVHQIQHLFQSGYNRIVPVYPTSDGRYAVLYDSSLYYLMPWLLNDEKEDYDGKHVKLFREVARMHSITSKEIPIEQKARQEHYDEISLRWEKETEFMEEFLSRCEEQDYMSPFEQLFCLYYHESSLAIRFAKEKLDQWLEQSKEREKVRTVFVHGKLSTEHFLYDDRGTAYFSNFEKMKQAAPFHDLLPFLSRKLYTYPKDQEEVYNWLDLYFRHFSLRDEEMSLFLSYLSYPTGIIETTLKYQAAEKKKESSYVRRLQRHYWSMKNTEYIVMKLDELEKQKEKAKQEAEGAAQ
ncbi:spore coat protein [Bacillus coahuilensis m2-6]|uniref:Spore coat protein n=3 Tax=Bacillus coahuilensis TaxID=408580 RepID=A0A147K771_9BACI|nr:spore coat protein [Bacillus coahuilensis p1.1.43]KUP07010.1 spore coat protein [Bacillus coahuilensis m2-6]